MTATERLRAMLDERGVEWTERQWGARHSVTTVWHAGGSEWRYRENRRGELRLFADGIDAEQAVEATLGGGLQAENEKLRELVDYMTPIAWYAASERERDRMRELGVETDG